METSRVQTKQSETREHGTTKVTVRMKQCFESKWSICVSTKILITASQSRTGNGNFWKWSDKFQSDRTDRSKRTTSGGGEFPCRLKHSIYFSKEAAENFGRIKSTHSLLFNFIKIMQRDFYHHLEVSIQHIFIGQSTADVWGNLSTNLLKMTQGMMIRNLFIIKINIY